jgi:hypothetical protein
LAACRCSLGRPCAPCCRRERILAAYPSHDASPVMRPHPRASAERRWQAAASGGPPQQRSCIQILSAGEWLRLGFCCLPAMGRCRLRRDGGRYDAPAG